MSAKLKHDFDITLKVGDINNDTQVMCEETSQQDRTRTDALIKDLTNCKINCFFHSMQTDSYSHSLYLQSVCLSVVTFYLFSTI